MGVAQSIVSERLRTEPTTSAKALMEAIIGTVENDVTETDLDILEGTKQRAGKTVDAFATRIYDQRSFLLRRGERTS